MRFNRVERVKMEMRKRGRNGTDRKAEREEEGRYRLLVSNNLVRDQTLSTKSYPKRTREES